MSASAKPVEKVLKSLLAVVLAVSFCPLIPAEKAQAQETGDSNEPAAPAEVAEEGGVEAADSDSESPALAVEGDSSGDDGIALLSDASGDPIVKWTECGTCRWMIDASGQLAIAPSSGSVGQLEDWGYDNAPWSAWAKSIRSVSISGTISVPTTSRMFYGCSLLASLDLSSLDTSKATDMWGMFYDCSSLESLDLSGLDTPNVTDMSGMFYGCSKLAELDLSSFDTANVKADSPYSGGMYRMFSGCSGLRTVTLGASFDFKNADRLPSPQGDGLTGRWVSSADGVAYEPGSVPSGVASTYCAQREGNGAWNQSGTCAWKIGADGCLSIAPLPGRELGELADWGYGKAPWLASAPEIKEVAVGGGVSAATTSGMFQGCAGMVSADLSRLDTSRVTSMYGMFSGCSSLASLNLSHFNTSNVTSMSRMFSGCSSLTSLDLSSFDTSKVKNMGAMYEPDNKEGMFSGCSSLKSLDLSNFDTSAAVCMSFMFYGCSSLTSLDLSGFATSSPANLNSMFYNCSALETIRLPILRDYGSQRRLQCSPGARR